MSGANSEEKKWTREEVSALIDAYKHHVNLFQTKHPLYFNKNKRLESLRQIASEVERLRPGVSPEECRKKFQKLRSQYNVENVKQKRSIHRGAGTDCVYEPSLWYFTKMGFLDLYYKPRGSRSSSIAENHADAESPYYSDASVNFEQAGPSSDPTLTASVPESLAQTKKRETQDNLTLVISEALMEKAESPYYLDASVSIKQEEPSSHPATPPESSESPSHTKKRKRPDNLASAIDNLSHAFMVNPVNVPRPPPEADEEKAFSEYVAAVLRGIKNADVKLELMSKISTELFAAKARDNALNKQ